MQHARQYLNMTFGLFAVMNNARQNKKNEKLSRVLNVECDMLISLFCHLTVKLLVSSCYSKAFTCVIEHACISSKVTVEVRLYPFAVAFLGVAFGHD